MTKLRKKSEIIHDFIIDHIASNPAGLISDVVNKFDISRQAAHKHIKQLVDQEILIRTKERYDLRPPEEWDTTITLSNQLPEDVVWRTQIREKIGQLPDNAIAIWQYGFTEMFNNVIDHSKSKNVDVQIKKTAHSTEMLIYDHGIGIFNKIRQALNLLDERHAVLELTKGKLTTDPQKHSGEGIFFTSRMFDSFSILSGSVFLSHAYGEDEDWILETREQGKGTAISMKLRNNTSRTTKSIFDKFTSDESYGFTKTVVPVKLAQYGDERLISRSQAKRLLERIERFKTVIFDFTEVATIGQAFADEVFRVFKNEHPHIEILSVKANKEVNEMISRALQNTDSNQGELFETKES
jgi:anti-sigma regulatory factor (Ser/Thr protein kinase)